jgi:ubiquinone/menaquinone biosynthesis C-methylase UbiE
MENHSEILGSVEQYYSSKIRTHGAVPQGVDWKDRDSQFLRFEQLLKIKRLDSDYSLNDIGCGFGTLAEVLQRSGKTFRYQGSDISPQMLEAAQSQFQRMPNIRFFSRTHELPQSDYSVASGIFNVRLQHSTEAWESYIDSVLVEMDRLSTKGFAFNMLTKYSDPDRMRTDLYYADPGYYFDLCKRRFSKNVALLHDYDLYEFTVLVRKDL